MLRHRRHAGGRKTKDRSLARFACPPAFVHFAIVICVSRDCMKTTYSHIKFYKENTAILILLCEN